MEEEAAEGKAEDEEYASAIRENMQLIDRKQSVAAELQSLIDSMSGGHALYRTGGGGAVGGVVTSISASAGPSSSAASSSSAQNDDGDGMYL